MNADRLKLFMEVDAEMDRALAEYGPFPTEMHGYAVLKSELGEAWVEIQKKDATRTREEMIQVAAMAVQFLADFANVPRPN